MAADEFPSAERRGHTTRRGHDGFSPSQVIAMPQLYVLRL
jgi:hypothetical protein